MIRGVSIPLTRELDEATLLARAAGDIILDLYDGKVAVDFKGKGDPVTEADRRANSYIVAELRRIFPSDGIVAEETEDRSDALRQGRCWYVDPLDGTKEFIAKNGEFSVMIGLSIDGESRLGVVFQPATGKLYRGFVGGPAELITKDGTSPLSVSKIQDPASLRLVVSRSHRSSSVDQVVERLGIQREAESGSVGLKVGLIAEQKADLYVNISDKSSAWDTCAPEAILRAAGGRFTDLVGGPINYQGLDVRSRRGILACNSAAYDQVVPVVREVAIAAGFG